MEVRNMISIFAVAAATLSAIVGLITVLVARRKMRVERRVSVEEIRKKKEQITKLPSQFFEDESSAKASAADTEEKKRADIQSSVAVATKVFAEHSDFIRAVIRYNVKNEMDADDIFQDFFLYLVDKPIPLDIKNIRGYLHRAIKSDILEVLKRAESVRDQVSKYAKRQNYTIIRNDLQAILVPTEKTQKALRVVGRQVPRHEAEAIIEGYGRDRSVADAAKRMRVTERTFSRYICIGLKKIRQFLSEHEGDRNDRPTGQVTDEKGKGKSA